MPLNKLSRLYRQPERLWWVKAKNSDRLKTMGREGPGIQLCNVCRLSS